MKPSYNLKKRKLAKKFASFPLYRLVNFAKIAIFKISK
jgi:hypothetical protein